MYVLSLSISRETGKVHIQDELVNKSGLWCYISNISPPVYKAFYHYQGLL